jgi:hypothetical protein
MEEGRLRATEQRLLCQDTFLVWDPLASSICHTGFPSSGRKSQVHKGHPCQELPAAEASCDRTLFLGWERTWKVLLGESFVVVIGSVYLCPFGLLVLLGGVVSGPWR